METTLRLKLALAITPEDRAAAQAALDSYLATGEASQEDPSPRVPNEQHWKWWKRILIAGAIGGAVYIVAVWPTDTPWRSEYLQQRLNAAKVEAPSKTGCSELKQLKGYTVCHKADGTMSISKHGSVLK